MKSGYCSPNSLQWIKGACRNFYIDTRCVEKHLPCNHIEILARTLCLPLWLLSGASNTACLAVCLPASVFVWTTVQVRLCVCGDWWVHLSTDRQTLLSSEWRNDLPIWIPPTTYELKDPDIVKGRVQKKKKKSDFYHSRGGSPELVIYHFFLILFYCSKVFFRQF